ncbi:site-specific integrase [Limnohabitans radicicola]|uniref:Tyrosine-type recombinase/integrase n=1 Tax=Limnohabitans radicicola TaxID=2771427 RepID=A0A927IL20_9BURK|nr:site-specific integrase [Limnohabitans radicicola]MBD8049700.1 tyrosine-type recombinase/integrase [Limnohabitans radicicola]
MSVVRLSEAVVQQLICPPQRSHFEVYDLQIRGLYVDVQRSGRMAYRLRYSQDGVKRHMTLGDARLITLDEARQEARARLRQLRASSDPERNLLDVNALSVEEFFVDQYLPYVKTYKRSWGTDESMIRNHILPQLGAQAMAAVRAPDIARMVQSMKEKDFAPGTINRMLVLLRYGYKLALRWKVEGLEVNPAQDLKNIKNDNKIERYLTPEQTVALMAAVRESENPALQNIVPFLIYTGARKREALDARWADIDWQQSSWKIPKTKSGKIRHVPLSTGALELLGRMRAWSGLKAPGSDLLFPNPRTGLPFVSIYYSWDTARKQAGVPELRIHDLRHSFASFLVNAGRSLYEVQELLGHADIRTTSRYAHLKRDRLMEAVQVIRLE